jgi:hypothetical protein
METDRKHLDQVLATLRRNGKRSTLFHWLAEHHDELLEAIAGERIDWQTAADCFKEAGLTDATGRPATPQGARASWYKVRRLVATRRERGPSPRPVKLMPSKLSNGACPPVASIPGVPPVVPSPAAVPGGGDWPTAKPVSPPAERSNRKLTGDEVRDRLRERLRGRNY